MALICLCGNPSLENDHPYKKGSGIRTPIFEILTDGKLFVYDVSPSGESKFGDDIIRAFQFKLGAGNYYKSISNLSKDWFIKVMNCK